MLAALLAAMGTVALPAAAHAAEFTDVLDAADDRDDYDEDTYDPFDLNLEPSFRFDLESATISREAPCVPQQQNQVSDPNVSNNPRAQFSPERCSEARIVDNREMAYRRREMRVGMRLRIGLFKDLELRLHAPYVISSSRGLKYADGVGRGESSVDPSDTRIRQHAKDVFDPNGSDADHLGQLSQFRQHRFFGLSDEYRSIERMGFADPSIGLHWAPFNDERDDTKATLALGADYTIPIAPIRRPGNDAVGEGLHKGQFRVAASKQFDWIEPYMGLRYTLQIAAADSPIRELADIDPQNQGQPNVRPPQKGRITVGAEFVPYENEETHERYAIDLRFQFGYATEGRAYSPIYDHMVNSRCNGLSGAEMLPQFDNQGDLTNPGDVACSWIMQRPANTRGTSRPIYDLDQDPNESTSANWRTDGIMMVAPHATFSGRLGVNIQPTRYFQLQGIVRLTHQQQHILTKGRSGLDVNNDGEVATQGPQAGTELNPAYNGAYDSPANRFSVTDFNTWSFLVRANFQF
jgi:hypothetical protein